MNEWLDVHALLDDELTPEDRVRVQALIKTNKECAAEWHTVRQVKVIVSQKCCPPDCEEAWKDCVKRLADIERTRRVESFVGRYAWGICGVFALVIVGAAALNRMNGGGLSTGDVSRVSASLVPISAPKSQAPDDVKQWLQENLGRTMKVPSGRLFLTGGALGHLPDGRRLEEVMLRDSQGPLRFYEVNNADGVRGLQDVDGHQGYTSGTMDDSNCVSWSTNGNAFVLEGDRSIDALCAVADSIQSQPAQ